MSRQDALKPTPDASPAKRKTYEVVFEHETATGRLFDVVLILAILASVVAIMLESVRSIRADWGETLRAIEWGFTLLFTVEYAVRLWCVRRPKRYALSFYGIVDLLAIAPTWLSLVVPGGQFLVVVRILRTLRIFRILKLAQFVGEASVLARAIRASGYKITVFVFTVITICAIVGTVMYLVEGPESGFTSIPMGMYWTIVTLTTVGFGDITPLTPLGQTLASLVMILGYGIIAVPTGIVTVELADAARMARSDREQSERKAAEVERGRGEEGEAVAPPEDPDPVPEDENRISCPSCGRSGHDPDAHHCKWCGSRLER